LKELVKLHHGNVFVESVVGKGSTFTVEIPLGTAHLPPERIARTHNGTAAPSTQPRAYVAEAAQWAAPAAQSRPSETSAGRILLVDDNADMREYLTGLLGAYYAVATADDGATALEKILADPPDLVLTDIMMPGLNGLELLHAIRGNSRTRTLPVIVISARAGEEALVEGLEHGADDYLVKPFTARELLARVAAHLEIGRLRRDSEARFHQLFAANVIGVIAGDEHRILEANDSFLEILGVNREELEAGRLRWRELTPPEYREADERGIRELLETGVCRPFEKEFQRADGRRVPVLIGGTLFDRTPLRWLCFVVDLTQRRELERRLSEKQKLESIGVLAGGIAHDFNNLLVGILGNATLIQDMIPENSPIRDSLREVVKASERAAHLTQQMLAYSGKGRFILERVNLSDLARETAPLLKPSIPIKAALHFDLANDLPPVEGDASQLQQVIMNLVLNAAEAIGEQPGIIRLRTGVQNVDRDYIRQQLEHAEIEPGEYAVLEVRDTGSGMDETVRSRIFDPFFTTKFTGRGLGLAAVAGIVRGHKGAIQVSSIPGHGSTFLILIPVAGEAASTARAAAPAAVQEATNTGSILVVDDEDIVRRIAKASLERHGFSVLTADSGPAAIEILREEQGRVRTILLDLSMPGMSGNEALPLLRQIRPDVQVIISSGYSEAETLRLFAGQTISGFIQKPFTAQRLVERVKKLLD
jgi:PAS domain S-box-containing protein